MGYQFAAAEEGKFNGAQCYIAAGGTHNSAVQACMQAMFAIDAVLAPLQVGDKMLAQNTFSGTGITTGGHSV